MSAIWYWEQYGDVEQNECESNVEMVDVVTQIHVILVALVVLITSV
mgnify:CR=1 FL=1